MFAPLFALLGAYPPCGSPTNVFKTAVPQLLPDHSHGRPTSEAKVNSVDEKIPGFALSSEELTRDIAHEQAIMFPIHRLPVELLAQVFTECVSVGDLDIHNPVAAPLVISQVSRQWRVMAHSMPVLWATFAFAEYPWAKECPNSAARRLDSFIARSGELPLSFRFSTYPRCFRIVEHTIDTHPVLSRLFKLSHRWRNVRLSLPYGAYLDEINRRPLVLPGLEDLTLESPGPYSAEGGETHLPATFSHSPRLTRLSLQKYFKPTRAFSLPWSQIRQLHLKENVMYGNDYGVVLQQATNLESLLVECNGFDQPLPTLIICPSMKSLTLLTKTSSSGVEYFLASLVLPNLTHLDLRVWKPSIQEIDAAVQFLDRSGSSVIHFTCRLSDDGQLVRLLEKMPHLTHVDLRGSLIGPSLVKQLNISRHPRTEQTQLGGASPLDLHVNLDPESAAENENVGSSDASSSRSLVPPPLCLLPQLESLLLSDDSLTPDLSGLTEAIISRIQISRESHNTGSVSPLKRVEVLLRKDLGAAAMDQFKKLVETDWGKHVMVELGDRGMACTESP